LKQRLAPVAARLLECHAAEVHFSSGQVFRETAEDSPVPFRQVCEAAYRHRVALFAQGYYRSASPATPERLFFALRRVASGHEALASPAAGAERR
jgi:hypothetical protein